jgi:hypothetical protein
MENRPDTIYFSPIRLWTIARNTMTEMIRQMFFYILVIFAVVVLASSLYFADLSSVEIDRVKFIKDFCLAAIKLFGVMIAIVGTAQLLPMELDNRTIYPILAKPVYRGEFLFGKFLGLITLLFLTTLFMTVVFLGTLYYMEHDLITTTLQNGNLPADIKLEEAIRQVQLQTRDPAIFKAIILIYFQMVIISSIALLIGTFATSVIFTIICTVIVYFCAHLESLGREAWVGNQSVIIKTILLLITFFIPDLTALDIVDNVVLGQLVTTAYVAKTIGYALLYSGVVLLVSLVIFGEKEI